jgi:cytochrome oxidase Cu insertion factor (SCO1/SenC/PrrC family)
MKLAKWWPLPAIIPAGLTLLLFACGGGSASLEPASGPDSSRSQDPAAAVARPPVMDFAISTGRGTSFSLSEHAGEVVVLYFSFPG